MARKVSVENSTDHLKKSIAELLVRRLVAVWVVPGVMIRRLDVCQAPADIRSVRVSTPYRPYVPEKLPPAEIGGCRFQEPQSDEWKLYHRNAVPPSQIGA